MKQKRVKKDSPRKKQKLIIENLETEILNMYDELIATDNHQLISQIRNLQIKLSIELKRLNKL